MRSNEVVSVVEERLRRCLAGPTLHAHPFVLLLDLPELGADRDVERDVDRDVDRDEDRDEDQGQGREHGLEREPFPRPGQSPAAALADLRPGPVLVAVLERLDEPGCFESWLSADDGSDPRPRAWRRADLALAQVQAWERQLAWTAARREACLAATADRIESLQPDSGAPRWSGPEVASSELAAALRISPRSIGGALERARRLRGQHAGAAWLLEGGLISAAHVRAVLDECTVIVDRPELVAAVESAVLRRAPELTAAQLRRATRRAVARLDPEGEQERHAEAAKERGVAKVVLPDAMMQVTATLTAPESQTVLAALDAIAAALPEDPERTRPTGRADALVLLCTAVLADPTAVASLGRVVGPRPAVNVTIALDTLLGLSERPGELAGYGPVPAPMARALAADGERARFTTDPLTGELLDATPHTYRISPRLRRFIALRDVTCVHPGCATSARRCDIDHVQPFDHHGDPQRGLDSRAGEQLGPTTRCNLCARCRRHHNLKTWYWWRSEVAADGTRITRSPLGRTYTALPTPQPTQESLLG